MKDARLEVLLDRWEDLHDQGKEVAAEELCRDYPELLGPLSRRIRALKSMSWLEHPGAEADNSTDPPNRTARPDDKERGQNASNRLLGEYTLLQEIGAGGMGRVFKAIHRRMDRIVAVKILPLDAVGSVQAVARFQQEVRAAAKMSHRNIVQAYDAGEQDGTYYLVMEYVEGADLHRLVQGQGPLPVAQAVDYVLQAARGLEYAHAKGIVHRDVKPANLLLDGHGTVKVLDMGLARFQSTAGGSDRTTLTRTGAIFGTVDYMSPEQAENSHAVDARSDIYSLGCSLYFLLTQAPLHPGDGAIQRILAHRKNPAPSLREKRPEVSTEIDAVFQRMVARKPDDRYQLMSDVIAAFQQVTTSLATPEASPTAFANANSRQSLMAAGIKNSIRRPAVPALRVQRPARRGVRIAALGTVMLGLLGLSAYQFGPAAHRILTNQGTGVIKADDADVQISIKGNGHQATTVDGKTPKQKEIHAEQKAQNPPTNPLENKGTKAHPQAATGDPLSPLALVKRPANIAGVKSWTIAAQGDVGDVLALSFSPDGRWLASASTDGVIRLWEPRTGTLVRAMMTSISRSIWDYPIQVDWSPDSQYLASGGREGNIQVWEADTGRIKWSVKAPDGLHALAWSPNGKSLAVGHHTIGGRGAQLYDAAFGILREVLDGFKGWGVTSMAWSPDSNYLATGTGEYGHVPLPVQVWDARTGKVYRELKGNLDNIWSVAWSADGKYVSSGGIDCRVRLWQADTGQPLHTLTGHDSDVWCVAFSPDSKRLASAGSDGAVCKWDVMTAQMLKLHPADGKHVFRVAWSPDGKTLASGGRESGVRLWQADSGSLIRDLPWQSAAPRLQLAPEGNYRGPAGIEKGLIYIIQTDLGQEMLSPEEFQKKYNWKNDPEHVPHLIGD